METFKDIICLIFLCAIALICVIAVIFYSYQIIFLGNFHP